MKINRKITTSTSKLNAESKKAKIWYRNLENAKKLKEKLLKLV